MYIKGLQHAGISLAFTLQSQNHQSWKRLPRPSSPTVNNNIYDAVKKQTNFDVLKVCFHFSQALSQVLHVKQTCMQSQSWGVSADLDERPNRSRRERLRAASLPQTLPLTPSFTSPLLPRHKFHLMWCSFGTCCSCSKQQHSKQQTSKVCSSVFCGVIFLLFQQVEPAYPHKF